jgi:hypothetical protein
MSERVHVFYRLQDGRYKLQFNGKTAYVEKDAWNGFIAQQHNRKNEGVSLSGGVNVEVSILEKIIDADN